MANHLVSVIVTTRNESANIARFIKSIRNQSYRNIELIVVDNNSTDDTPKIARKFVKKVYNFGPERSAQRNYGAKKADGAYFLFLDADMELTKNVVKECVEMAEKRKIAAITIPESTVGNGFIPKVRKFEREMYMGEPDYEVPRFFDRRLFFKYGGYDEELTGPEDYDLPYRIRQKHDIGRIRAYLYHHEDHLTLKRLLAKKYYYAKRGAFYAIKHPRLVKVQGTILFRRVYLKNWRKFTEQPLVGMAFLFVRLLETIWAVAGFISAVGLVKFFKTSATLFK